MGILSEVIHILCVFFMKQSQNIMRIFSLVFCYFGISPIWDFAHEHLSIACKRFSIAESKNNRIQIMNIQMLRISSRYKKKKNSRKQIVRYFPVFPLEKVAKLVWGGNQKENQIEFKRVLFQWVLFVEVEESWNKVLENLRADMTCYPIF